MTHVLKGGVLICIRPSPTCGGGGGQVPQRNYKPCKPIPRPPPSDCWDSNVEYEFIQKFSTEAHDGLNTNLV